MTLQIKSEDHHWILYIWISVGTKFQLKLTYFEFLDQICPNTAFPVKKGKIEYHHWILHIWISQSTKFQLKLTILVFWTKFVQKGYLWPKRKKMNTTIEF